MLARFTLAFVLAGYLSAQPPLPPRDADAPNAPMAEITNGMVHARLYLPNAERGYYRATRFDSAPSAICQPTDTRIFPVGSRDTTPNFTIR